MHRVGWPLAGGLLLGLFCVAAAADKTAVPRRPAGPIEGALVICGGGRLPEPVRDKFLELAGGEDARLVVCTTANRFAGTPDAERLAKSWRELDVAEFHVLHASSPAEADTAEFVKPLLEATGVWFIGGLQSRITDLYLGTRTVTALEGVLARGGVVGGTSAGAAIMSPVMIRRGNPDCEIGAGLGFLPGVIVDQHFVARNRQERLLRALKLHPGLAGLGIDEGTALLAQGRRLTVMGDSTVTVCLSGSHRPARVEPVEAGTRLDLVALSRAAIARTRPAFPPQDAPDPAVPHGTLIMGGGGGLPPEVMRRFVAAAGGRDAPIVVVSNAAGARPPSSSRATGFLRRAGLTNVTQLHARTPDELADPRTIEILKQARGIWFSGGRQWRFVDAYLDTRIVELFRDVLRRGGVIAGSSAGATIQGDYLARGNPLGNRDIMAEGYERGFAFLPGTAIDQHFSQRNRFDDMAALKRTHPQLLGFGIDESTAVVVQGESLEVIGRHKVFVFDGEQPPQNGRPKTTVLEPGDRYHLLLRERYAAASALEPANVAADDPRELTFDELWTPKPATHPDAEPWETETDVHWVDDRFQQMDTGPFFSQSIKVAGLGLTPKAVASNTDPDAHFLFDTQGLVIRAVWTGPFLTLKSKRFGLLEMPEAAGTVQWTVPLKRGWQVRRDGSWTDADDAQYVGLHRGRDALMFEYRLGQARVRELAAIKSQPAGLQLDRIFEIEPLDRSWRLPLVSASNKVEVSAAGESAIVKLPPTGRTLRLKLSPSEAAHLEVDDGAAWLVLDPTENDSNVRLTARLGDGPAAALIAGDSSSFERPHLWGPPLITRGKRNQPASAEPGPFEVDTITAPYENRYRALMFTSGLDFLPDGTAFVSTAHGDVWRVTGLDAELDEVRWQRFATGLYQPLGLRIVDGNVFVLGRDQITRLHDTNGDGEADFYECFNNDLTVFGQPHAYAMCLETDPEGNFYFLKSGHSQKPHGGSLLKVSRDGKTLTRYASGFRHPNGLGVGPEGQITAADNEGNWVPKTRIDWVRPGGFYGYMFAHQRKTPPRSFDGPLCWIPRSFDNSAGGQVWVPPGHWGPLSGKLLHLSYGRCWPLLVLHERVGDVHQGGTVRLPIPRMLSGIMRGRFAPHDGHLYLTGLDGWQTAAVKDGCLHRVRYVGGPLLFPISLHVHANGVELGFAEPLDRSSAVDPGNYSVEAWRYRWTQDYGSKDYRVSHPDQEGHDGVPIERVHLSPDGRRLFLEIPSIRPVMQMGITGTIQTAAGRPIDLEVYNTIHKLGPARREL